MSTIKAWDRCLTKWAQSGQTSSPYINSYTVGTSFQNWQNRNNHTIVKEIRVNLCSLLLQTGLLLLLSWIFSIDSLLPLLSILRPLLSLFKFVPWCMDYFIVWMSGLFLRLPFYYLANNTFLKIGIWNMYRQVQKYWNLLC